MVLGTTWLLHAIYEVALVTVMNGFRNYMVAAGTSQKKASVSPTDWYVIVNFNNLHMTLEVAKC